MPLDYFLNSKIKLYNKNISDQTIDNWQMWKFQTNIDKFNNLANKTPENSINMSNNSSNPI